MKIILGMNVLHRSKLDFPNGRIKFNLNECINKCSQEHMKLTLVSSRFIRGRQENSVKVCEAPAEKINRQNLSEKLFEAPKIKKSQKSTMQMRQRSARKKGEKVRNRLCKYDSEVGAKRR